MKSTSLLFGDHIRHILPLFAIGFLAAVSVAGYLNQQGLWYYIISIGAPTLHFTWQITTLRENDPQDCWKKFEVSNLLCHEIQCKLNILYTLFTVKWYPRIYSVHWNAHRLPSSNNMNL